MSEQLMYRLLTCSWTIPLYWFQYSPGLVQLLAGNLAIAGTTTVRWSLHAR